MPAHFSYRASDAESILREHDNGHSGNTSITMLDRPRWRRYAQRTKYYIPALAWMSEYSFSLLGNDFIAGLTVASVLIPQSISYASSLGRLSPVSGLLCASIPGLIYALLGTSRQLNVGPTAAVSLLIGQALSQIRQDILDKDPTFDWESRRTAIGMGLATIVTLQARWITHAGLISFLLGLFRLGFIDVVLSRAVLRGFITALAAVIVIEQLAPLLGLAALERTFHPTTTLEKIIFLWEHIFTSSHRPTALISLGALAVLIFFRILKAKMKKRWPWVVRVPEVLLIVIISTFLCHRYKWNEWGVDVLGSIQVKPSGSFFQQPFRRSNLRFLRQTTSTALLICVVGFLDSIAAAKQNGARFGHSISPNRELVALGAANLVISFVPGTITAFGSTTRSRINGDSGGRSQMSSIICSIVVLLVTFFLMPLLYYLPKCVLASIIILVAYSLLEDTPRDISYYLKMKSGVDLILMALTFVFSMIWEIEEGILASVIISLLLVVRKSAKTRMSILGRVKDTNEWEAVESANTDEIDEDVGSGVLIVKIRENLDFANTAQLKERLHRIEMFGADHVNRHPSDDRARERPEVIVLDMGDVEDCDASAVQILHELVEQYKRRGVSFYMTSLRWKPLQKFTKGGLVEVLGEEAFQDSIEGVMAKIDRYSIGSERSSA